MDIQYVYSKKRSEFGRQCVFSDRGPELIDNHLPDFKQQGEWILKNPVSQGTQCSDMKAEHDINTIRADHMNSQMNHNEGGWPKDINPHDEEQTKRYRRKIEKDEAYVQSVLHLTRNMEHCILQNNAVNIYQQYFADVEKTPMVERSRARTVNVYQDQYKIPRPVNHLSWSPDGGTKIAVTHCNLDFQAAIPKGATDSYIWELENPNKPLFVLKPHVPLVCVEYNQRDPNSLVAGMFNGQVSVWDTRKGTEPVDLSVIENSHRDPVHNVLWINSKSGTEFFSSATDGQVKWWDTRKLSEPLETLLLDPTKGEEQSEQNAMGASCLEYESTVPTRFMVGTEHGVVLSCNRKGKTAQEKIMWRFQAHLGPVLALQRNQAFVKNFLTVGDWTAKIWSEDCRESSIIWTSFHKALLTDGGWSPSRYSVFFTTRSDGTLDAWDVLQQQKHACLSFKVCDEPLRCLRVNDTGRVVGVGNQRGATYLVEFSENLATCNRNDKSLLTGMFERESHREKILEGKKKEIQLKAKTRKEDEAKEKEEEKVLKDPHGLKEAERDFWRILNEELGIEHESVEEEEEEEEEEEGDEDEEKIRRDSKGSKKEGEVEGAATEETGADQQGATSQTQDKSSMATDK